MFILPRSTSLPPTFCASSTFFANTAHSNTVGLLHEYIDESETGSWTHTTYVPQLFSPREKVVWEAQSDIRT